MNSIRKKILYGFFGIVFFIVVLGILGLLQMKSINSNVNSMYNDQVMGVNYIKEAQLYIAKVQRAEKNVLLSTTVDEKKEHSMHIGEMYSDGIVGNLVKFKEISEHDDLGDIESLIAQVNGLKELQNEIISESINGNNQKALELSKESAKQAEEIEKLADKISKHKIDEAKKHYDNSMQIYKRSVSLVGISVTAAVIASILMSLLIASSIIKPLQNSVQFAKEISLGNLTNKIMIKSKDELGMLINTLNNTGDKLKDIVFKIKSSSSGVGKSSAELSHSIEESNKVMSGIGRELILITNNINEVVSAIERNKINTQGISDSANQISNYTKETVNDSLILKDSADRGKKSVEIVVNAINNIHKSTTEVKDNMNELSTLSKKISSITTLITNIASQTNTLALNAAIEAARAGEQGRGFYVVAEEVRKLAEESSKAAKSIENIVVQVREKIEAVEGSVLTTEDTAYEGTKLAGDTNANIDIVVERIDLIVKKVETIYNQASMQADLLSEIAASSEEITNSSQKVAFSTQDINNNIEGQIAVIQRISTTSEDLHKMAESLNSLIEYFKI